MATKARMHWFWRGTIGAVAGVVGLFTIVAIARLILGSLSSGVGYYILAATAFLLMPVSGIATYGLLTRRFGPPPPDGELHCRRCDHILRGLSEPRCPECGEAI